MLLQWDVGLLFLVLIQASHSFNFNFTKKSIRMLVKTLQCEKINQQLMSNATCTYVPTKNGFGHSTVMFYDVQPTNDLWIRVKFFRKSGYKFVQVISTWDLDWCGIMKGSIDLPPFTFILIEALKKEYPALFKLCPIVGEFGIVDINVAEIFETSIPQVISYGTYKLWLYYYRKSDEASYGTAWGTADVAAVDVKKSFKVG